MPYLVNALSGKFDYYEHLANPILFKGAIAVNTDFPLIAEVQIGWLYVCNAGVTDNAGVLYTNTGQTFNAGDEIAWVGSSWDLFGNADVSANRYLSNLQSPTAINQHLTPGLNITYDVGTSLLRWRAGYFGATSGVNIGTNANNGTIGYDAVTTSRFQFNKGAHLADGLYAAEICDSTANRGAGFTGGTLTANLADLNNFSAGWFNDGTGTAYLCNTNTAIGGSFIYGVYSAQLADNNLGKAGHFTDGTRIVDISDGTNALTITGKISQSLTSSASTSNVTLTNVTDSGTFNTTAGVLTNKALNITANATRSAGANDLTNYGIYATASGGQSNIAGYFVAGTKNATLGDANFAGIFRDGTHTAYLGTGTDAAYFYDGVRYAYLADDDRAGYFTDGTRIVALSDANYAINATGNQKFVTNGTGIVDNTAAPGLLSIDPNNRKLYASDGTTVMLNYSNFPGVGSHPSIFLSGAGNATMTGDFNFMVGSQAGASNTTGTSNNFIGNNAGFSNTEGNYNNFIGSNTGYSNTTGGNNTFIGRGCGYNNTTGEDNIAIGRGTGARNSTGSFNIFLGYYAGNYETGSYKIYIDNRDRGSEANDRTNALIYGVTDATRTNQTLAVNANLSAITAVYMKLTETKTDTYNVTTTDTGKTLVMNSANDKIFNLPSVDATNVGTFYTFVKIGAGKVTIDAADSDLIADSSAGGTIYDSQASETYATITLQLVSATQWVITGFNGTWTTT
jgi:hypothetical protein